MEPEKVHHRLSAITTVWTLLRQVHGGPEDEAAAARRLLLERYGGAVRRYLLSALHDTDAADDLTQEFALRLVRGDFHNIDPQRGRFRDYLKTVLFHLVSEYRQRQVAQPRLLPPDSTELRGLASRDEFADHQFREDWRQWLLTRAWTALAEVQPSWHAVLRFRTDHPELPAPAMAEPLSKQLGKSLSPEAVRQTLHRARERFADLLLDEIAHSLESDAVEQLEEELRELDLLKYCQPALERWRS